MLAVASIAATLGAATWSLSEYLLHRFRGHESKKPNTFAREHLTHHSKHGYFTPNKTKLLHAGPVIVGVTGGFCLLLGPALGVGWGVGFSLAYMGYEWTHRRLHTHPPTGPWGRRLRRHHFFHHFHDGRTNHGVTSPVWDRVFGTEVPAGVIEVPRRFLPVWLDDGEGEVRAEYRHDYRLRSKPSRGELPDPSDVPQSPGPQPSMLC